MLFLDSPNRSSAKGNQDQNVSDCNWDETLEYLERTNISHLDEI